MSSSDLHSVLVFEATRTFFLLHSIVSQDAQYISNAMTIHSYATLICTFFSRATLATLTTSDPSALWTISSRQSRTLQRDTSSAAAGGVIRFRQYIIAQCCNVNLYKYDGYWAFVLLKVVPRRGYYTTSFNAHAFACTFVRIFLAPTDAQIEEAHNQI